ncbi:MAG: DNA gyrase inhibitor YacG [Betaproteobacteria bacterium]
MPAVVKCPTCGRPVEWSEASKFRPFCSARCKTIDLGAWASDRYVVPGGPAEQADETPPTASDSLKH